jgi:hypothetical protein
MFHVNENLASIEKNKDARIEYFVDSESMPEGLTKSSDLCLAQVNGNTTTFEDASWSCVANEWNITEDGWLSFPFRQGGLYSLIVNPDADLIPASKLCGFWCDYQ